MPAENISAYKTDPKPEFHWGDDFKVPTGAPVYLAAEIVALLEPF